jgi:hypothetical protein
MLSKAGNQGALYRALGSSGRKSNPGVKGALGRVISRVAPQGQKNPQPVKGNHMFRNAGPIKTAAEADGSISETGEGLRQIVGRLASRGRIAAAKGGKIDAAKKALKGKKPKYSVEPEMTAKEKREFDSVGYLNKPLKRAEGGKVSSAMSALKLLAKKYQHALDMGDDAQARRLKREIAMKERAIRLSNQEITPADEGEMGARAEAAREKMKVGAFAKGGKVKATKSILKGLHRRLRTLEGKMAYGEIDKKTGRVKGETPEQSKARDEYDRLSDEIESKFGVTLIDDQ